MPISLSSKNSIVGITTGDPRGIGPEVTKKALLSPELKRLRSYFLVIDEGNPIEKLDKAARFLKEGRIKALVTAPVSKEALSRISPGFIGHTEYLAGRFKVKKFAMMFSGKKLKVLTVTRHIPVSKISESITREEVFNSIDLADRALKRYFKIKKPRIAVCGLNPHCGESGAMGKEEINIINPAIKAANRKNISAYGPVSADAVFHKTLKGEFDIVISMYHDQGLAPFKMMEFNSGVNLTLGLPFIRTSPDHGTAYDIAGRNAADCGSMIEAMKLAYLLKDMACL